MLDFAWALWSGDREVVKKPLSLLCSRKQLPAKNSPSPGGLAQETSPYLPMTRPDTDPPSPMCGLIKDQLTCYTHIYEPYKGISLWYFYICILGTLIKFTPILLFLIPPPPFKSNNDGFHYSTFIHAYKVPHHPLLSPSHWLPVQKSVTVLYSFFNRFCICWITWNLSFSVWLISLKTT
jgi:hypothetical protein